ncbi:hypothetical protein CK203_006115 [Vitis vinifera]|uniref:Uncharacterized protein n=1 Tax=Vitis vinifera TaxID=29760 RepID=A0A438K5H8_VITVI|nr:hypothetical protein CK203_006115 [Vitis vinifera]
MSMFLRSLHPRFARHLTGVPFQDFRSLVQALFDVDDGISRGLWSDIIPSLDTEMKRVGGSSESYGDICSTDFQHRRPDYHSYARSLQTSRSDFPPLQHRHPHSVQQYPSVHPHTVTVRPSFQFQRPQTSIPRHEQSRPHRRRQRTYSDLGMPLDRAFERLRSTGVLVPLAPRPFPSTLPPRFDLIDSGAVSFPISTTDTDLGPDMTADSFPVYSTHAVPPPSGLYHHVWTPRALIFTGHFDTLLTSSVEVHHVGRDRTYYSHYSLRDDGGFDTEVERIELILSEHPSSSRGAPGVAMPSLPHLTSSTPVTLGASHPRSRPHSVFQQHSSSISLATPTRPPPQFRGPPVVTVLQDRFPPHRRCHGILAPLAPRALPNPVPPQFRLDLYCMYHQSVGHHTDRCTALRHAIQDIVDFGTFGHPQSDMFPIPTSAQAMHADAPSPAVEYEEFEPRVDLTWRGLAYDLWVAYDVRIGRLLDETVTYFAVRKFRPNWSGPYFIRELTLEGRCMVDGFRWKPILGANQCGSAKEREFWVALALGSVSIRYRHHLWGSFVHVQATHLGFDTSHHHYTITTSSFCFICLLIDIIFALDILRCRLRQPLLGQVIEIWLMFRYRHASSSGSRLLMCRSDSVVFGLPGSVMDPHGLARSSLTGCSSRRGHDRYLTEPLRSTQPGPHFSTLGCHHASPSGRCDLWIFTYVAWSMIDDFMSPDF